MFRNLLISGNYCLSIRFCQCALRRVTAFKTEADRGTHQFTVRSFSRTYCKSCRHTPNTMKILVSVLFLVLTTGNVRGYIVNRVDISNSIDDECPLKDQANTPLLTMVTSQQHCVSASPEFLTRLLTATSMGAHRRIFRDVCAKVPQTRDCVAAVAVHTDACLRGAEVSMFNVFKDVVVTALDDLCYQNGERMAVFFGQELKSFTLANQHRAISCFHAMTANALFKDVTDYSAYSLQRYGAFKSLKRCIGNVAHNQGIQLEAFDFIINDLIDKSKCVARDTGDLVTCKDIDTN